MNTPDWYVLRCKPHKEHHVHSQLVANTIEVYYPTVRVRPANPRSARIRPYFPGYLFVHVDLDLVGVSVFQWLPGTVGLVEFDGYPPPVPGSFIRQLQQRLEAIRRAGGLTLNGLKKGDPVRITAGPLAGYEAVFDMRLSDSERVRVFLDLLGRLVRTEVNVGAIEKKRIG